MQQMTLKHTTRTRRFIEEHHDNCTNCSKSFESGETTHLGYTKSRKLIYVGDCCSNLLVETIIRHSFQKRVYSIPDSNTPLWRFMDFTKFISLLTTKSLFFSRADKLGDPFEGAKVSLKNRPKWNKFYTDFFKEAIRTAPNGNLQSKSEQEISKEAKMLLNSLKDIGKRQVQETFVNCWYEGLYESDAMWKVYSSSIEQAIAIRTTYKRLYNSLGKNPSIQIGRVNYIDFSKQFIGINDSFWYKRKSFEHEKEVRAIIIDHTSHEEFGKFMPINIDMLIDKVYLSPASKEWFKDLVCNVTIKYRLKKRVIPSQMAELLVLS